MKYTNGFLRTSPAGKYVGVLKYRDPAGEWRQVTKTFSRDRRTSELEFARWRGKMAAGAGMAGAGAAAGAAAGPGWPGTAASADGPGWPGTAAGWPGAAASADGPGWPGTAAGWPGAAGRDGTGWPGATGAGGTGWPGGAGIGGGTFPMPSPTVEEAVRACLATQLARRRIERSTHDMQLAYAERELFPELGAVPLAELTPTLVQTWLDRVCLGISPGSARIPFSILSKTCGRAVREGVIASNPLDMVEAPTRTRPTRAYLPPASVALLNRALDEQWGPAHPYACATRLALYAGLRAGETCGLRWRDVELTQDHGEGDANGTGGTDGFAPLTGEVGQLTSEVKCPTGRLRVATSIGRTLGGCYVKGPKNASSAREFPIVPRLAQQLARRRDEVRSSIGGEPSGSWFVCGERDVPLSPHALSHSFAKLCERAGITDNNGRRATFHMLRHTFATRAVRAGVDVRTLADLLGHARADVTLNVYAASGEDAKLAATSRLEAAFAGERGA